MALCMSARLDTPYPTLIEQARAQLKAFETEGGLELLADQFADGELVQRTRGKPVNTDNLNAVRKLKAEGMTQAQIVQELGLSPTIVNRHWKRIVDEEPTD